MTGFDDGIVVDGVTGSGVELSLNTVKENGVGIRVTTSVSDILDAVQIGTAAGRDPSFNTIANNETGVRIEDEIGTVATDVQTIRLVPANAFDRNDKNILPEPGTPPVDRSPSVTTVPDGATIHVPDAATGPVRADLPDVTLGDGISVQSITASLAPASGRTITLDTSVSGGGEPLPLGSGLADYFSLTATPSGVVSDATLTISVAKDQVADPDRFSVWRFTNGEWATLPTERLGTTSERFFYQVRTPGFSTFAATEVPDDPTTHSPFLARLPDTIVAGSIEVFGSGAEAVERSVAADFVDSGGEPLVFDFSSLSLSDGATAEDVLQFTNTGDSAAWVRMTSAATGVAFTRPSGIPGIEVDMSLPFQLGSDASVDVDASREPIEPDDQLWARLVVPALAEEQGDGQELVLGNEVGLQSENVDAEYVNSIPEASFEDLVPVCTNDRPAPVMLAKDYAAPGETPDWVPQVDFGPGASLPRNGVSHNRVEARIRVEQSSDIEQDLIIGIPQAAPSMDSASSGVGRMISVYDPEENIFERDDNDDDHFPLTEPWASDNPDKIGIPIGAEDLAEGPVEKRVDLIFETVSPCDQPINDVVFDYVQNLGLTVQFDSDSDSDRTWQDVAGTTSTTATMDIYSTGASLAQQAQNVADKAMNIFAERVIAAAFPSPVQMYGAALRAVSAPAGALVPAAIGIANNLDSLLTDTPLTPDNILQAAIVQGIVEYEAPPGTESVPSWLQAAADEVAGIGPTVYVSGDPPDPKGAVAGTVVTDDGSSSTPIEGVTVESQTTGQTVTTNEDGVFALTLPPGEDTLQFQPPEESDPPFGSEEVSVTVDAGEVQDGVTVTLEAQSETGFTDDFDYPTSELAANEWTVVNGTFETSDSFLLGDAGFEPNRVRIYREQARASGTFEFRGVRNQAAFFGLRIDFVSNGTTVEDNTAGYRLQFRQRQQGDVLFRRIGEEGPETLLTIDENHGGNPHDVRIDRDPETFAFTIYYDGEEVGTVEDDTVTESTYWTMAYGGDLGTQRIDRVEASEKAELEYTLTVTDASGTAVGSVSVEDTFDASEYGEHVAFSTVGDTQFDNDRGIIDHVRLESGEVIEDWEVRGLDDYTRTATGGGDFEIVESPTANGQRALTLFSGCCGDTITSNDELLSELEAGTTVRAEVRHQTDNSITFAHTTGLKLGTDADGNGGIDARLINPGSQRIAGARLRTPNADGRIEFEPNLQEFYTFTIEIGD